MNSENSALAHLLVLLVFTALLEINLVLAQNNENLIIVYCLLFCLP